MHDLPTESFKKLKEAIEQCPITPEELDAKVKIELLTEQLEAAKSDIISLTSRLKNVEFLYREELKRAMKARTFIEQVIEN